MNDPLTTYVIYDWRLYIPWKTLQGLADRVINIDLTVICLATLLLLCHIYLPLALLKVNHTVWNEGAMSGTTTCALPR